MVLLSFVVFEVLCYISLILCVVHVFHPARTPYRATLTSSKTAACIKLATGVVYGIILEYLNGPVDGSYTYTPQFGIMIVQVPLCIAAAWSSIIYSSMLFSDAFPAVPSLFLLQPFIDTLYALALDFTMDALAVRVGPGFWVWSSTGSWYGIPIGNYMGWLFVVFSASLFIRLNERYVLPWIDARVNRYEAAGGRIARRVGWIVAMVGTYILAFVLALGLLLGGLALFGAIAKALPASWGYSTWLSFPPQGQELLELDFVRTVVVGVSFITVFMIVAVAYVVVSMRNGKQLAFQSVDLMPSAIRAAIHFYFLGVVFWFLAAKVQIFSGIIVATVLMLMLDVAIHFALYRSYLRSRIRGVLIS